MTMTNRTKKKLSESWHHAKFEIAETIIKKIGSSYVDFSGSWNYTIRALQVQQFHSRTSHEEIQKKITTHQG